VRRSDSSLLLSKLIRPDCQTQSAFVSLDQQLQCENEGCMIKIISQEEICCRRIFQVQIGFLPVIHLVFVPDLKRAETRFS
jgi:hypothetical protein